MVSGVKRNPMATITTAIALLASTVASAIAGAIATRSITVGSHTMDLLVIIAIGIALGFFMTVTRRLS